jgi:hypothetical protein
MLRVGVLFDAFLDGFSGAGLFGRLRRPGAPDVIVGEAWDAMLFYPADLLGSSALSGQKLSVPVQARELRPR